MQRQCQNLYYAQYFRVCCVVGYTNAELREGFKGAGACFVPVSGKTIDLTDLKVNGYDEIAEGDCYVQVLDNRGRGTAAYYWYDLPEDDLYGWLDGSDEPIEAGTVTFAPGDSFWVNAPADGYTIQSAGQVATTDVIIDLRQGFKLINNPTPVSVDLIDISVAGYDEVAEGDCYVQVLDNRGRGTVAFYWYDLPEDDLYGWLDGSDEPIEEGTLELKPGESLWVNAPAGGYTITIPGVTL